MGQEERERNFESAASRRVNNVITSLNRLGHCSNKSRYSYTDEQVAKMFRVIRAELAVTEKRFTGTKKKEFKF